MKSIGIIILVLISINIFAQNLSECGKDNNPKLTQTESKFLNEYMNAEQKSGIDLTEKNVLFLTGPGGSRIGDKSGYFKNLKSYDKDGRKIVTWIVQLDEKERIESGYDIIITYWVKSLTKRRKQKY